MRKKDQAVLKKIDAMVKFNLSSREVIRGSLKVAVPGNFVICLQIAGSDKSHVESLMYII